MLPTDLDLLHGVSDPQLQPGGDLVAYVVSTMDVAADETTSKLHVLDLTSGEGRVFTGGPTDSSPRWSPDGSQLAFLRSVTRDDKPQLAVLPADGGEARVLTELPLGVTDLAWTPTGDRIVVAAAQWRADVAELDDEARAKHPRRILDRNFRGDGAGWVHDRTTRLWLVSLDMDLDPHSDSDADGGPVALTPEGINASAPTVTADGAAVLYLARPQEDGELHPGQCLWRVPLEGGEPQEVLASGWWMRPLATEDGGVLLAGLADAYDWPAPPQVHRVDADGERVQLAPGLDRDVPGEVALAVVDGGVLALVEDRGEVHLRLLTDEGHTTVVGGAQTVTGFSASPDGGRVVYTATHPTDPGELWVLQDGEPRVLTAHNADLRETLLPVEHFTFERDGAQIDAWAVLPEGDGPVPLLLNIHGGPTAQYGFSFFDEFQVEAAAGYAVVGCNPRGSSGRGTQWSTAVVGAWTDEDSVDMLDLRAAVDAMLERHPRIDAQRIGIMGGSYGGYATARILANDDRFASAIVERGLLSWPSFAGTSDIGAYFDRMFLDRAMPEDVDAQWAASPVGTAMRITTPTLVLHSLEDHRCPPEQAYQLFSVLRRAGVESELLLFPDEGHELSRSGSPLHRRQRFDAVLDWHARYLLPDA